MGRYVYVGEGTSGFQAVAVTEHDEPQAVIGSYLHKLAYPENYAKFAKARELTEAYEHGGTTLNLQLRGEYLYAAKGHLGVEIYDVADIDNKRFAERILSAPVSPVGQRLYVKTKDARWIASPTTLGVDPARRRNPENEEQPIHLMYAFLYVADAQEGLILINAATLLDGDPRNNFLKRSVTFNPGGALNGANFVVTAGDYVYVSCERGLVIVSVEDPTKLAVVATVPLQGAGHSAIQFRYAFVDNSTGVKVIDITDVKRPLVKAAIAISDARDIYVARTYAYVAAGKQGLAMVNVGRPERPGAPKFFNAGGAINDARAVKIGMTNASLFAYVADGRNGLRVLQLTAPNRTEGLWGFSPPPEPELIATFRTKGEAVDISKGLDRDRAVDESGNQLAVFGRRGARPFHLDEMQRLYLRDGRLYTVTDQPPRRPAGGTR
jgi:hypothetical protein